jgi:hypothetical protein
MWDPRRRLSSEPGAGNSRTGGNMAAVAESANVTVDGRGDKTRGDKKC